MRKIESFFHSVFFRDRLILISAAAGLILNIILWILLASKFGYSQEKIALHFNVVYGIDFVGDANRVYQIAILGLLIFIVNLALAKMIYGKEKLLAYFLTTAGAFVQIILLIAALSLLNLNFP